MKKNNTQNQQDQIVTTLKNMLANHDLAIDFSSNVNADFFSWHENLVSKKSLNKSSTDFMQASLIEIDNEKLSKNPEDIELFKKCRFSADMAFCFLQFHDFSIQNTFELNDTQRQIFNEFEKLRVVLKASESYIGVAKNIFEVIEKNIINCDLKSPAMLLVSKKNNLQEIINNYTEINSFNQKLLNKFNSNIIGKIEKISQNINNPKLFAKLVYDLVLDIEQEESPDKSDENNNPEKQPKTPEKKPDDLVNNNNENFEEEKVLGDSSLEEQVAKNPKIDFDKITIFSDGESSQEQLILDQTTIDPNQIAFKKSYKIYTDKFDEIIFPNKLIKNDELKNLRNQLDLRTNKMQSISKKMRMKLKRKLLSKRNCFMDYDASRGVLDRKKLSRIIINPFVEDIWVNNKTHEYQDTALTILLDNSGSMRGNPIITSALACEIIADILQNFAVKTEIIGFTTADWKGGRVKKLWEMSGRPVNPGRLNELRHIVYKHFNQNFKKARINLGLMLKEGILKENIDGEALLFAKARLMQQSEKRKILLVISDGNPVDDSTTSVNDKDILSQHLHHVINNIEKKSKIEIVGIGIGHSTSEFYRNSIAIKNVEELGDVMIDKIADLL
jgi:cobaltochelatase CobT